MTGSHRSVFFFSSRRRHTRWPRDWSSDVCLPISTRPSSLTSAPDRRATNASTAWVASEAGAAAGSRSRATRAARRRSEERRGGKGGGGGGGGGGEERRGR